MSRVLVWYSDGAASAVAAKLAIERFGERVEIIKCDTTVDEHPDNLRFRGEVEGWIGQPVILLRSEKYANVDEVFEKRRYMAGVAGAPCTTYLKKIVRQAYQRPDDVHVFGYTMDEASRIQDFEENNPDLSCEWVLRDAHMTKARCLERLAGVGITLPVMYALGFEHNNCLGCVKATSPGYWNRTRQEFPEVFAKRARQSHEIGASLVRVNGKRIGLYDLDPTTGLAEPDGQIECGPFCEMPATEVST